MPFISIRDIEIYFESQGRGPRLLYLGGTGGDLRRTPNVFDYPLAGHFEILTFDQRGLGRSSRPDQPYTMADYAADADALLAAMGWAQSAVMGVSFGGMVGQELAIRYPQRVARLVLACTSSGGAGGASYPLHELTHLPLEDWTRRTLELGDTRLDAAWQAAQPAEWQALLEQNVTARSAGQDEPNRQIGALRQIEARQHHNTYDRLPQIKAPTYICGGRYDGIAPPSNQRALQHQIPGAKLELFEGGHGFLNQDPLAFNRIIAFLNGDLD